MDSKALGAWAKPWSKSNVEHWPLCEKVGQDGRMCTGSMAKKPWFGVWRDMGRDIVTGLSFRISLAGCICLTSKVPGHDPVW
jgi:hypothetical protein